MKKLLFTAMLLMSGMVLYGQDSTATVHFYRTSSGKGALVTYKLFNDTTMLGLVKPGTVFHYKMKPGVNEFTSKTESKKTISINAKPGEEYYVKCSVAMGIIVGNPKFELVNKTEGAEAIAKIELKIKSKEEKKNKSTQ